ncbi:MAG: DUF5723 family protein [Bacteroidota bacterium]|nr:DUF5723 family protein [Bacteroidota bacterium]MDP4234577.1 DUF5723 family protein [Bacteroidota bacterium]MDP4243706.1 DUF5723 family protein [Bacteroidota bacterium]MDP4288346.1 DUF5723 family protein [Bacteroidota bacterium]
MVKRLVLLLPLLCIALSANAQEGVERLAPFAHGAGRTYAVTARGLDAVGLNPALLAYGTPRAFELVIAPISSFGISSGSSLSSINNISSAFKTDSVTGNSTLLDQFYHNQVSADLSARIFGLSFSTASIGTFAVTWDVHAAFRSVIPDALLNYVHPPQDTANFVLGTILPPQQVDVQGVWYNEYGISYGKTFFAGSEPGDADIAGGLTLSYVQGIAYMRVNPSSFVSFHEPGIPNPPQSHTNIQTQYSIQFSTSDAFNGKLPNGLSLDLLSGSTAGSGIGVSPAIAVSETPVAGQSPRWRFGLSVTDIGSIRWTSHTDVRRQDSANVIIYTQPQGGGSFSEDSIRSYLKQLGGKLDTTDAPFTSSLPTTLHIAAALDLSVLGIDIPNSSLSVASEFAYGFTDVVGSPQKGRFGLAAIFDRPSTSIAFHTAVGITTQEGTTSLTVALGAGIGNAFFLDLGTSNISGLFSSTGRPDFAAGMKILF